MLLQTPAPAVTLDVAAFNESFPEEVGLRELIGLRHDRKFDWIGRSPREARLNGKRVRFKGYLQSSAYQFVQPEQLLGTIAAQLSPDQDSEDCLTVWLPNSTTVTNLDLFNGTPVEVEATVRKPLFGPLIVEQAQITKAAA